MSYKPLWEALEAGPLNSPGVVRRRVAGSIDHDLFLGITTPEGKRALSLVVDHYPTAAASSVISTRCLSFRVAESRGRYELRIVLQQSDANDIFDVFVEDVVKAVSSTTSDAAAIDSLVARFERWKFVFGGSSSSMSQHSVQGLFGEIWAIRHFFWAHVGSAAIQHWYGPDRELVDFQFDDLGLEVKTTSGSGPPSVIIQSERQLSLETFPTLLLLGLIVDIHSEGSGQTLNGIVSEVQDLLDGQSASFDEKLLEAGYLAEDAAVYERYRFTVREIRTFQVAADFPKLSSGSLPLGVDAVRYRLALGACEPWRVTDEALADFYRSVAQK